MNNSFTVVYILITIPFFSSIVSSVSPEKFHEKMDYVRRASKTITMDLSKASEKANEVESVMEILNVMRQKSIKKQNFSGYSKPRLRWVLAIKKVLFQLQVNKTIEVLAKLSLKNPMYRKLSVRPSSRSGLPGNVMHQLPKVEEERMETSKVQTQSISPSPAPMKIQEKVPSSRKIDIINQVGSRSSSFSVAATNNHPDKDIDESRFQMTRKLSSSGRKRSINGSNNAIPLGSISSDGGSRRASAVSGIGMMSSNTAEKGPKVPANFPVDKSVVLGSVKEIYKGTKNYWRSRLVL